MARWNWTHNCRISATQADGSTWCSAFSLSLLALSIAKETHLIDVFPKHLSLVVIQNRSCNLLGLNL